MIVTLLGFLIPSSITSVVIYTILLGLIIWHLMKTPQGFPPGPRGIPLLGYVPYFGENPAEDFMKMGKQYGPIIGCKLGRMNSVIINDYDLLKKAFATMGDVFTGRPEVAKDALMDDGYAMFISEGVRWRELRRFALTTLKNFGMGKSGIEPRILDEMHYLTEEVTKMRGEPVDLLDLVAKSVCNATCVMEFGRRFEFNDPDFNKLKDAVYATVETSSFSGWLLVFPWMSRISFLRKYFGLEKTANAVAEENRIINRIIQDHKRVYYPGKRDDYIDVYLEEQEKRKDNKQHVEIFSDETLLGDLKLLFIAGMETSSDSILWCFMYLLAYPEMQTRIRNEIDSVIGQHRTPSFDDRINMPYTEAFMNEVWRKRPIAPLIDPHKALEDVEFEGYHIPKGTAVYGNCWAIHHDHRYWSDPDSFRPERFLDRDGKFVKPEQFVVFSLGKRVCIGETLGRMLVFHCVTAILQKFILLPLKGEPAPKINGIITAVYSPLPFKMRLIARNV